MKISLKSISKTYGKIKAVDDISLTMEPGQIIAVLGINGAGKSTLLKMISGLIPPDKGEVHFDQKKLDRGNIELKKRLVVLPDYPAAFFEMTPVQHVAMLFKLYEAEIAGAEEKITQVFKDFNILACANTPIAKLSRGQMYKSMLAAAISLDPELWVLDEPFASGMDPNGITNFRRQAKDAASRGRTIIYSTQIPEVNEGFCDKICIMNKGRIIAFCPIDEIINEPGTDRKSLYDFFMNIKE